MSDTATVILGIAGLLVLFVLVIIVISVVQRTRMSTRFTGSIVPNPHTARWVIIVVR
jgi:hypothetical protein